MKHALQTTTESEWRFWSGWGLAFLGFPLGGVVAATLIGPITTPLTGLLGGVLTGGVIGAVQWFVFRRRLPLSPGWIAATAVGMGLGMMLSITLLGTGTGSTTLALRGLIVGAGVGIAQYLLLRNVLRGASVWALVVALSWAVSWLVTRSVGVDLAQHWSVFGSSGALLFQLLTGLALAWLLHGWKAGRKMV